MIDHVAQFGFLAKYFQQLVDPVPGNATESQVNIAVSGRCPLIGRQQAGHAAAKLTHHIENFHD